MARVAAFSRDSKQFANGEEVALRNFCVLPGGRGGVTTGRDGRNAIELRDVAFSYDRTRRFIEGVSLGFEKGALTSVVGPNGCGKSTLLKIACGIVRPRRGEVLLEGRPMEAYAARERARRLALLSQGPRPPAMSVESLVACGRFPHSSGQGRLSRADREAVEYAMELADVTRFRSCDVGRLSGGERQRAFIAMTLSQDTDIVVLDEPTTYLDIGACHDVMRLVRRLNEEHGKTIVLVIHDLDLALRYSDKVVVVRDGSVIGEGEVGAVYESRAIDEAFGIDLHACEAPGGDAYVVFPRASARPVCAGSTGEG